ncbi:hypothetical protein [Kitasatospora sp. NPDC004531]
MKRGGVARMPVVRVWVVRERRRLVRASFRPSLAAERRDVPLPTDAELLEFLSSLAAGRTREAVHMVGTPQGLAFCRRGTEGSVPVSGSVAAYAETFHAMVRRANRKLAKAAAPADAEAVRARAMRIGNDRNAAIGREPVRPPLPGTSSVDAVSGGLPGQGRRSG